MERQMNMINIIRPNLLIQRDELMRNIINIANSDVLNQGIDNGDNLVNQLFENERSSQTPTNSEFVNSLQELVVDQSFLDL